jgi:ankyrin repeat protein
MTERDPNARDERGLSPAMHALYRGELEAAERLVPEEPNVFEAAAFGLTGRLRELLDAEPALASAFSGDGFTALHLAAFTGHPDAVRLLLERDADPNAVATSPEIGPVQPLHSAAATRQLDSARLLVEHGADVNARQAAGFTPLHEAAGNGDVELGRLLLEAGADSTARKDDGQTPADVAAARGHDAILALLG